MKYYDAACVVIFLKRAYTLNITSIIQRFAGKDIKNTKIEDIPGTTQIAELDSWFLILASGGSDITLGGSEATPMYQTPEPTHFNGEMQSSITLSHNSTPAAADMTMMEIDTARRSHTIR